MAHDKNKLTAPLAGDQENTFSGDVTYLAPLPFPTLRPAKDYGKTIGKMTETYADFGGGWPSAFVMQCAFGMPLTWFAITLILFPLSIVINIYIGGESLSRALGFFFFYMPGGEVYVIGALAFLCALYARNKALLALEETIPPRFNRQRREVCFIVEDIDEPIFVPWESLTAWVSEARHRQHGSTLRYFSMGFGFYHAPSAQRLALECPCASLTIATSKWEAIRAYMEYEVHTLSDIDPQDGLHNPDDPPHEGLHTFYNAKAEMKRQFREREVGVFYVMGWYLYHVMTLWTLAHRITEYDVRQLKLNKPKVLPQALIDWSESLPPEQWAKPSAELLKQSAQARALHELYPGASAGQLFACVQALQTPADS